MRFAIKFFRFEMKKMLDYVRLMRCGNLLFIVLIQFLMSRAVVLSVLHDYRLDEQVLPLWLLVLLVLATVLLAAGGYVINDYFDIKIDRINRPEKLIISHSIPKKSAIRFYQILTAMGVVAGFVVAGLLRSGSLAFLFLVVPGVLWFY